MWNYSSKLYFHWLFRDRWYFFHISMTKRYFRHGHLRNTALTTVGKRDKTWKTQKWNVDWLKVLSLSHIETAQLEFFNTQGPTLESRNISPFERTPWRRYISKCSLFNCNFTCVNKLLIKQQHNTYVGALLCVFHISITTIYISNKGNIAKTVLERGSYLKGDWL